MALAVAHDAVPRLVEQDQQGQALHVVGAVADVVDDEALVRVDVGRVVEQRGLAGDVALDGDREHAALRLGLLVEHVVEVDQRGDVALVVRREVAVVDARDAAVHERLLHRREVLGHHLDHGHDGVDLHRERLLALDELEVERVDVCVRVARDLDDLAVHLARHVDVLALGVEHDHLGGRVGEQRPQDRVLGRDRLASSGLAQDEAVGRDRVAAVVEDEVLGRLVLAHPHASALHELDRGERHEGRERGGGEVSHVGDVAAARGQHRGEALALELDERHGAAGEAAEHVLDGPGVLVAGLDRVAPRHRGAGERPHLLVAAHEVVAQVAGVLHGVLEVGRQHLVGDVHRLRVLEDVVGLLDLEVGVDRLDGLDGLRLLPARHVERDHLVDGELGQARDHVGADGPRPLLEVEGLPDDAAPRDMGVVDLGEVRRRHEVLGGVAELDGADAAVVGDLEVVEGDEAARVVRVGDRVDDAQQLVAADLLRGDAHVLERAHDLLGGAGELRRRLLAGRRLDGHDEQAAPLDVLLRLGDLALDDLVDVAAEAVAGVVALHGRQEGVGAEGLAVDDAAQDLDLEVDGVVEGVEQFGPVLVDLALLGLAGSLEAGVLELHDAAVDARLELHGAVLAQQVVAERVLGALVRAQHERAGVVLGREEPLHALLLAAFLGRALAFLAGLRGLGVELLLAAGVAALGADLVPALLAGRVLALAAVAAAPMAAVLVSVRVRVGGRAVRIVVIGVAGRGLALAALAGL